MASEWIYSATDGVWPVEQEARHLESLSSRETFLVAVNESGVGFQRLDLWPTLLPSRAPCRSSRDLSVAGGARPGVGRQLCITPLASKSAPRQVIIDGVEYDEVLTEFFC